MHMHMLAWGNRDIIYNVMVDTRVTATTTAADLELPQMLRSFFSVGGLMEESTYAYSIFNNPLTHSNTKKIKVVTLPHLLTQ